MYHLVTISIYNFPWILGFSVIYWGFGGGVNFQLVYSGRGVPLFWFVFILYPLLSQLVYLCIYHPVWTGMICYPNLGIPGYSTWYTLLFQLVYLVIPPGMLCLSHRVYSVNPNTVYPVIPTWYGLWSQMVCSVDPYTVYPVVPTAIIPTFEK